MLLFYILASLLVYASAIKIGDQKKEPQPLNVTAFANILIKKNATNLNVTAFADILTGKTDPNKKEPVKTLSISDQLLANQTGKVNMTALVDSYMKSYNQ